jgi:hypothetical protein
MKQTDLRASSNNSWLEATQLLIAAAQQKSKNLRCLSIKEDAPAIEGKFSLKTQLINS